MLQQSFRVFAGVGPTREQALWQAGIHNWQQFLDPGDLPQVSEELRRSVGQQVQRWSRALSEGDARFLAEALPRSEHWRLFEVFGDSARYLDIETTGLSAWRDDVTVVGIHDGQRFTALINGQGLSAGAIQDALAGCKLLITYFGSSFDVPFLRAAFPELRWDFPHFDLCFAGRRAGLTGGLKGVERTLGIARDEGIVEVDGFEAVRLWRRYTRGDQRALNTLIEYNGADTRNLARIAPIVYERLCRKARVVPSR